MTDAPSPTFRLVRPQNPRDPHEKHRVATPLELLFDLVTVIAVASAAAGLHHSIAEAHALQGLITFAMAFFAIWWAWMNFTWFSSAYDNDDVVYRLLTMLAMGGSLTISAGIPALFTEAPNFTLVIAGYSVMRLAMIAFWLRAAYHDPKCRATALGYAAGILICQLVWIAFAALQPLTSGLSYVFFAVAAVMELCVPAIAERLSNNTSWHPHHIVERYGLLNIIVLGETLLSGSMALRQTTEHFDITLVDTAISSLIIVFAMWWAYFSREGKVDSNQLSRSLQWGYGHYLTFASGAATGAGFAVVVDIATHHAHVPMTVGNYAVAIPVAVYLVSLWLVRERFISSGFRQFILPAFGLLALLAPVTGLGLKGIAASAVLGVIIRNTLETTEKSPHH